MQAPIFLTLALPAFYLYPRKDAEFLSKKCIIIKFDVVFGKIDLPGNPLERIIEA